MTFLDLCQQRYSARDYKNVAIEEEKLDYIIRCAQLAPSAVNFQPWKIKIISKSNELKQLQACYNRTWFETAPCCLVVYKNKETEWVRKADQKAHGDIDCAILIEHLCLAAAEVGLGTCWVCNFNVDLLKSTFPVPDYLEPVALIPIGYAADTAPVKNRKARNEIII
ncbi:MAG: nitroreductase family protein [Bacteroidaceae bacterium]|nr:nitroreductase family protein [Bacteroidaceae bacterium]